MNKKKVEHFFRGIFLTGLSFAVFLFLSGFQSTNDSFLGILVALLGCLCGIVALVAAVVVVVLVKKGKASSSYKSVFNDADDHFSVMD